MSTGRQAPEIYAKPLSEFSGPGYPPVGTPEHEQTVVTTISLGYAAMGWNAAIVANAGVVRVVAVPHSGIQPLAYLEGLCAHGFIEDALPGLEALDGMVDDPDVAYTYGLALSELGRTGECLIPLNKCLRLDPGYDNAAIAIGVALSKLRRFEEAEVILRSAVKIDPNNPLVVQNLAATLARAGKFADALVFFREAVRLSPKNPAPLMGLAQCLDSLGDSLEHRKEALKVYKDVVKKFPDTDYAEAAKRMLNKQGQDDLRKAVDGGYRLDAVEYMLSAFRLFDMLPREKVGNAVLEIARLGEQGLAINDPLRRYRLENLEGDFSGLQLLCYMHVGIKYFDPTAATGSGLDKEYGVAREMAGK
ncbi:MAG: tetratricopeptide repeat protein [Candidatus Accumulibacter sp.]|jgi:tetratricopeptide (TPR) repeat protein|uniref:tetratricopeptide repeat protein n=1 Tax=Accumulibacter sp. TaxID=2053492 RepID=UPI001AC2AA19|nr:tetratricopeptide repeat protein [Accumulibacter sp.]MBK8115020.1 tetratricopeptide repeat protein [Accumulibacter sp.]MBN8437945.1 tetratricopeptide repeat protein [Accumulibacter sp.]